MIALLLQKCVKNILWIFFLSSFPKSAKQNVIVFLLCPPPPFPPVAYFRLPTCFLLLLVMPLRHLDGWLSIIQKFPRDLNGSSTSIGNWDQRIAQVNYDALLLLIIFLFFVILVLYCGICNFVFAIFKS